MPSVSVTKGEILIVDDNPANLELLLNLLKERDYRVRITTRGRLVQASVKLSAPDLILLDINMPDMTGYQVCQQLKADTTTSDIPIIFISALDEVLDKVKAFEVGGVDYITKPFHFEEVLVRVESQLKISRLQKEMARKNLELARKNEELTQLYNRANLIFAALSENLSGWVLDEKYRLEDRIGAGGHGVVYRATHLPLNRPVAVKVFQPSSGHVTPEALSRFRLEGISACRVNHPNAISILDFGVSDSYLPYLVMELLEGHSLTDELKKHQRLSVKRCLEIINPVCSVLVAAHAVEIVHRDIKPENIFLHQTGGEELVKVVDFGIAKTFIDPPGLDAQNLTGGGRIIGTLAYMAPERLNGMNYDGKADVYSLGITMYEMLTGQVPFEAKEKGSMEVAIKHLTQQPPPLMDVNPKVPQSVAELVMRALAKEPEERPTASQFAQQLNQLISEL